jgi:hypothetical protein
VQPEPRIDIHDAPMTVIPMKTPEATLRMTATRTDRAESMLLVAMSADQGEIKAPISHHSAL